MEIENTPAGARRIRAIGSICLGHINLCLLCLSPLEEISGNLREGSVGQNILFALRAVLLCLLCELLHRGLDQIRGAAHNTFRHILLADNLLYNFFVHRLDCLAVLAEAEILCLLCAHLVTLAHQYVHDSLCTDDLGRRCYKRRLTEILTYSRYLFEYLGQLVGLTLIPPAV